MFVVLPGKVRTSLQFRMSADGESTEIAQDVEHCHLLCFFCYLFIFLIVFPLFCNCQWLEILTVAQGLSCPVPRGWKAPWLFVFPF